MIWITRTICRSETFAFNWIIFYASDSIKYLKCCFDHYDSHRRLIWTSIDHVMIAIVERLAGSERIRIAYDIIVSVRVLSSIRRTRSFVNWRSGSCKVPIRTRSVIIIGDSTGLFNASMMPSPVKWTRTLPFLTEFIQPTEVTAIHSSRTILMLISVIQLWIGMPSNGANRQAVLIL